MQDGFLLRFVPSVLFRLSPPRFLPPPPPPPRSPSDSAKSIMSSRTRARCSKVLRRRSPSDEDIVCDTFGICGETRRRRSWLPQVLSKLSDFLWDDRCCLISKVSSGPNCLKDESSHLRRLYSLPESVLSPEWLRLLGRSVRSWLEDHRSVSKIAPAKSMYVLVLHVLRAYAIGYINILSI